MGFKRRNPTKNPPFWSHEFVIQNHGDIVSCLALVFVVGLMFQFSSPWVSMFVVVQHNMTLEADPASQDLYHYTTGLKDLCTVFFYFLICIVLHAVVQEYILDKANRKMHLSKVKHSKFNESGQLLAFYLTSVIWGGHVLIREGIFFNIWTLWEDYPQQDMTFALKFWWLLQICYWLHSYPELYFQRVKRDEWTPRLIYSTLYLFFLTVSYVLNFTRIGLVMAVFHYAVECVFHASRLLYFAEKTKAADTGFMLWNGLFIIVRLLTMAFSILIFWYGLAKNENQGMDHSAGNYNSQFIRLNSLVAVFLLQAWMTWYFITFHIRRNKERKALEKQQQVKKKERKPKKQKEAGKKASEEDVSELPEVDQNTKKTLKQRK